MEASVVTNTGNQNESSTSPVMLVTTITVPSTAAPTTRNFHQFAAVDRVMTSMGCSLIRSGYADSVWPQGATEVRSNAPRPGSSAEQGPTRQGLNTTSLTTVHPF